MFKKKQKNEITYFTSTKLEGLHHVFTTRGFDLKNTEERKFLLEELDFGKKVPQKEKNTPENESNDSEENQEIKPLIKCDFVMPEQEHTTNIAIVKNKWDAKKQFPETDGIIITVPNIPVVLCFADCTPVVIYSQKDNVLAVLHAGWKGTAGGIVKKACKILTEELAIPPKNLKIAIGACISVDNYEVSEEVKTALEYSLDGEYDDIFIENKADLKKINAYQAIECGVVDIDTMEYCTYSDNDLFYSYRKENQIPKRHGIIAQLKEDLG